MLVALASLALAWAGFQGAEWARERVETSDEADALGEEADQLTAQAERLEQQETVLYVQWLVEMKRGAQETADRVFALFRPDLKSYVNSAPTDEDGVPLESPFESPEYDAQGKRDEAERVEAERRVKIDQTRDASANIARYSGLGVILAVALVLSGIAGRFSDPYRRGLEILALAMLVIALVLLVPAPLSTSAP
jgi:hypothetical protein